MRIFEIATHRSGQVISATDKGEGQGRAPIVRFCPKPQGGYFDAYLITLEAENGTAAKVMALDLIKSGK